MRLTLRRQAPSADCDYPQLFNMQLENETAGIEA